MSIYLDDGIVLKNLMNKSYNIISLSVSFGNLCECPWLPKDSVDTTGI